MSANQSIDKLQKRLLAEEIEERILRLIRDTPYEIGSRLPNELRLSQMFGAGRSTVREALKSLESRRVVSIRQGSGTYVRSLMPMDMDPLGILNAKNKIEAALDLVAVRLMLEPEIASLAARNADEEDKKEILRCADMVEKLIQEGQDYLRYDIEFHSAIAKASKNSVIKELIPIIDTAVMMFVNVTHKSLTEETVETHRAITDAILKGDPAGAEAAMMMHLLYNRKAITALL